ncbi:MAG: hypothetical protein Kow0010_07760 [Dehalococcoidia bacterium]
MLATKEVNWLTLDARIEPQQLRPGTTGCLVVEAAIPEGGHIEAHEPPEPFLIPTVLEVAGDDAVAVGPVHYPRPSEIGFDWSPVTLRVLAGVVRFEVPVSVAESALGGTVALTARLRYQACTQGACLPPNEQTVTIEAPVVP